MPARPQVTGDAPPEGVTAAAMLSFDTWETELPREEGDDEGSVYGRPTAAAEATQRNNDDGAFDFTLQAGPGKLWNDQSEAGKQSSARKIERAFIGAMAAVAAGLLSTPATPHKFTTYHIKHLKEKRFIAFSSRYDIPSKVSRHIADNLPLGSFAAPWTPRHLKNLQHTM